jgi:hypothetical protein
MAKLNFDVPYGRETFRIKIDTPLDLDLSGEPVFCNQTYDRGTKQIIDVLSAAIDDAYSVEYDFPQTQYYEVLGHVADSLINNLLVWEHPRIDFYQHLELTPQQFKDLKIHTQIMEFYFDIYIKYHYLIQNGLDASKFEKCLLALKTYCKNHYSLGVGLDLKYSDNYRITPEDLYPDFNFDLNPGDVILSDSTLGFSPGYTPVSGAYMNTYTPLISYNDQITLYFGKPVKHDEMLKRIIDSTIIDFDYGVKYKKYTSDEFNYGYLKIGSFDVIK